MVFALAWEWLMNEWQRKHRVKELRTTTKKITNFEKITPQIDQIIYFSILSLYITKILVAYQNE